MPTPKSNPVAARFTSITSPLGPLLIAVSPAGLCAISWLEPHPLEQSLLGLIERGYAPVEASTGDDPELRAWAEQLAEYFGGTRHTFEGEFDFTGTSAFTERALRGILAIPWGEVRTYGQVATGIGMPGGTQAVGNAMGRNPIPVEVPCHRVIRAGGEMGHYTGGPHLKAGLLAIEEVSLERNRHPGQLRLLP